jgi:hypothetical protein
LPWPGHIISTSIARAYDKEKASEAPDANAAARNGNLPDKLNIKKHSGFIRKMQSFCLKNEAARKKPCFLVKSLLNLVAY